MLGQPIGGQSARKRALVIDDDPDCGALVGLVLRYAGYEVDLAFDGGQGLQRAIEASPDVVILDVRLVGMDGWAVLERLRRVSAVPVVMMTAMPSAADERLSRRLGADAFISKPFAPRDLASRVARITAA
jgi:DNA-binding response OmpR family regulator